MNTYEKRLITLTQNISFLKKLYSCEKLRYWIDIKTNRVGIPQRLWAFRKSLNMTEEEFAQSLGLKPDEYEKYECIGSEVPDSLLKLICTKYQIDKAQLKVL